MCQFQQGNGLKEEKGVWTIIYNEGGERKRVDNIFVILVGHIFVSFIWGNWELPFIYYYFFFNFIIKNHL